MRFVSFVYAAIILFVWSFSFLYFGFVHFRSYILRWSFLVCCLLIFFVFSRSFLLFFNSVLLVDFFSTIFLYHPLFIVCFRHSLIFSLFYSFVISRSYFLSRTFFLILSCLLLFFDFFKYIFLVSMFRIHSASVVFFRLFFLVISPYYFFLICSFSFIYFPFVLSRIFYHLLFSSFFHIH